MTERVSSSLRSLMSSLHIGHCTVFVAIVSQVSELMIEKVKKVFTKSSSPVEMSVNLDKIQHK